MVRFHSKLKSLKNALQINKEIFGKIRQAKCTAEDEVIKAEQDYDRVPSKYHKINSSLLS